MVDENDLTIDVENFIKEIIGLDDQIDRSSFKSILIELSNAMVKALDKTYERAYQDAVEDLMKSNPDGGCICQKGTP